LSAMSRRAVAWRELARAGAPVKQPGGDRFAFLPDLRFEAVSLASFETELALHRDNPIIRRDIEDDLEFFSTWLVLTRLLWGERDRAWEILRDHPRRESLGESLDRFLVRLAVQGAESSRPEPFLEWATALFRAEAGLRLVAVRGETIAGRDPAEAADGLRWIAGVFLREWARLARSSDVAVETFRRRVLDEILLRLAENPRTERLSLALADVVLREGGGDGDRDRGGDRDRDRDRGRGRDGERVGDGNGDGD